MAIGRISFDHASYYPRCLSREKEGGLVDDRKYPLSSTTSKWSSEAVLLKTMAIFHLCSRTEKQISLRISHFVE